jgi:hypothetical protein
MSIKIIQDPIGYIKYTKNNELHREDGPAVEWPSIEGDNGHQAWYLNGKRHRENGPAVFHVNGDIEWYYHGALHRENGPAIESTIDGTIKIYEWYLHDMRHRENGPAVECSDGYKEFWLNNVLIPSEEEYWRLIKLKNFW